MLYFPTLVSIIEVIVVTVPVLLTVAFVSVAERKTMASMQRRLGPNIGGYYGLLQAFADALKLILKEFVSPTQANLRLFFLAPIITLIFSLLAYALIPYGPGLTIGDFNLGILYMLAVSSLSTYGILLAGWSANSKYAFLGSLRSTALLISYELILSSAILLGILLTGSLNLTVDIETQRAIWFIVPLFPVFVIFFIGSLADTDRAPFDLAEAESERVRGFMTEHVAVIFVCFFLALVFTIFSRSENPLVLNGFLWLVRGCFLYLLFNVLFSLYHGYFRDALAFFIIFLVFFLACSVISIVLLFWFDMISVPDFVSPSYFTSIPQGMSQYTPIQIRIFVANTLTTVSGVEQNNTLDYVTYRELASGVHQYATATNMMDDALRALGAPNNLDSIAMRRNPNGVYQRLLPLREILA